MTFSATGLMAGVLQAQGTADFSITTNAPVLGALAGGTGTAMMTFSAVAVPSGIGHMSGSTETGGELTEAGIANASAAATVAALQATIIPVDVQQVRGQDLEGTGSDVDPWGPA